MISISIIYYTAKWSENQIKIDKIWLSNNGLTALILMQNLNNFKYFFQSKNVLDQDFLPTIFNLKGRNFATKVFYSVTHWHINLFCVFIYLFLLTASLVNPLLLVGLVGTYLFSPLLYKCCRVLSFLNSRGEYSLNFSFWILVNFNYLLDFNRIFIIRVGLFILYTIFFF